MLPLGNVVVSEERHPQLQVDFDLIRRLDRKGPRYTSYPTADRFVEAFDADAYRRGDMTPVYFGSALKEFGVDSLIEALASFAPPPRAQPAEPCGVGTVDDSGLGGREGLRGMHRVDDRPGEAGAEAAPRLVERAERGRRVHHDRDVVVPGEPVVMVEIDTVAESGVGNHDSHLASIAVEQLLLGHLKDETDGAASPQPCLVDLILAVELGEGLLAGKLCCTTMSGRLKRESCAAGEDPIQAFLAAFARKKNRVFDVAGASPPAGRWHLRKH